VGYGNSDPDRSGGALAVTDAAEKQLSKSINTDATLVSTDKLVAQSTAQRRLGNSVQPGTNSSNRSSNIALNFQQQNLRSNYRPNVQSPPIPAVLQNFQVIQTDNKVQIIDGDGSVYEGVISAPPLASVAEAKPVVPAGTAEVSNKAKILLGSGTSAPPRLIFNVSGYNKTLKQQVVLNATNILQLELAAAGGAMVRDEQTYGFGQPTEGKFQRQSPAQQNVLRGQVTVGGTNEFPIEAIETK
jgi:hypothetical protein